MKKLLLPILCVFFGTILTVTSHAQCMASFTWSQTYNNEIDFVSNSQNVTNGATIYAWNWGDNNSSFSNTSNTINHIYQTPGVYLVCLSLYDSATQCSGTFCDSVVVYGNVFTSPCNANFSVYMDSVNTQQAWIYDLSTGGPGMTFQWYWGDNTMDTAHYASHVYSSTGSYNVCLVIVDQVNQCTDTMCQTLLVARLTPQAMSAPFYVNVVGPVTTSVQEEAAGDWNLSPNPAQHEIRIRSDYSLQGKQFRVLDVAGRTVSAGSLSSNSIDVSGYENGMYILQVENANGAFTSSRFIKN